MIVKRISHIIKWFKERVRYLIFFFGLILSFAALMGDEVDEIPLALWFFAPDSYYEGQGIQAILANKTLNKGDEGFDQITQFMHEKFVELNKDSPNFAISDLKLEGVSLNLAGVDSSVSFVVNFPECIMLPQKGDFSLKLLQENVEKRKIDSVLPWRFILFFIGALLETYGCFMEAREAVEAISVENYYSEDKEELP